jgi:drug/metabolite transporter (DMT)-like permease
MTAPSWLWIAFTLIGAAALTARNAMQRGLITSLGTVGATQVRFLFGLPFAALFLIGVLLYLRPVVPPLNAEAIAWTAMGGLSQIVATGLMLASMRERSFVIAIAYTKTEAVQVAVLGTVMLGDWLTAGQAAAIVVASLGVMLLSWPRRDGIGATSWRPALLGISAGGLFALASVGFRGGIQALGAPSFIAGASVILTLSLVIQTATLTVYLVLYNRTALLAILRDWRPSLFAGFMGALSSQMWFLAFAIETAAKVRTLGLVEILFAQVVSRRLLEARLTSREILGIAALVLGVAMLLWL